MMILLKVILGAGLLLAAMAGIVWLLGSRLPRDHQASRTILFTHTLPTAVWQIISDQATHPNWRTDLKANIRQPEHDGHEVWRNEATNGDSLTLEVVEAVPQQKLVTRIVDTGAPFGGQWTYNLESLSNGSRLTITESGWVRLAFMRAIAYYVIGFEASMDTFLIDLAKRLGEDAKPQPFS